jgi:hypothetical protein
MAIHGEPDEPRGPFETSIPDVDPGEALRRPGWQFPADIDWRPEAAERYDRIGQVVAEITKRRYAAEDRQAQFETGNARETDQFQAWLEHAIREGTVERQLSVIDEVPYPPNWLKRYASYVRRCQVSTAERLVEGPVEKEARFIDTGTFFYEIPRGS